MERGGDGRSTRWQADLPTRRRDRRRGRPRRRRAAGRAQDRQPHRPGDLREPRSPRSLLSPAGRRHRRPRGRPRHLVPEGQARPAGVRARASASIDDPHRPPRPGLRARSTTRACAKRRRNLIDDGVLTTWLLNTASARQLGLQTTGHASRGLAGPPGVSTARTCTFQPGDLDQAGLMRRRRRGPPGHLDVRAVAERQHRRLVGGLSGFWFEDGELAYPVTEITVAGNLLDIYARMVPGSDLEIRGSTNAPSLLVDGLAIAGLMSRRRPRAAARGGARGRRARLALRARAEDRVQGRRLARSPTPTSRSTPAQRAPAAARPDYGWLSEETADDPDAAASAGACSWSTRSTAPSPS